MLPRSPPRCALQNPLQGPQCPMSGVPGGLPNPGMFGLLGGARKGHPKLFWEAPLGLYILNPTPSPKRGSQGMGGQQQQKPLHI